MPSNTHSENSQARELDARKSNGSYTVMATLEVPPLSPVSGRSSPTNHRPRSPMVSRRKRNSISRAKLRERQDFFRKYSPLSSSDLLRGATDKDVFRDRRGSWSMAVLDPTGRRAYYWSIVVSVAVIYFLWTFIFRIAFSDARYAWWLWLPLDALFYAVYVCDYMVQMRTSYLNDGVLEEDLEKLWQQYKTTWYFKLDVLAVIPFDWMYLILFWSTPSAFLHIFKLCKIYRLRSFFSRAESRSHFPNTCRVLFLMHNLLVIIHWNACIYFLLSQLIGLGSDHWVYPCCHDNDTTSCPWNFLSRKYIYSFYWSTLTLTTIGELPEPQTNLEYVFVITDYLLGILMFATLVGNVGSIIANMHKNRTRFQNKMDNIKSYMKQTKVPDHLQERVIKWFDYLWTHDHPVDENHALNSLPDKLKAEIGIHVHFETLKKVDFFEQCEQGLLWELVLRLRTQVYSPGEYVCRKGDVGREMYIVNNGRLEVLEEENSAAVKELVHGEYFGEISVLNIGKSLRRRTAFVRSVGYSSLLCLSQSDLLDVLKDYPKTMEMLIHKGKMKLGAYQEEANEEIEQQEQSKSPSDELYMSESSVECEMSYHQLQHRDSECSNATTHRDSQEFDTYPPMELRSVADQVIDVNIRLSKMEELVKEVLKEVRNDKVRKEGMAVRSPNNSLATITERLRKISSQI